MVAGTGTAKVLTERNKAPMGGEHEEMLEEDGWNTAIVEAEAVKGGGRAIGDINMDTKVEYEPAVASRKEGHGESTGRRADTTEEREIEKERGKPKTFRGETTGSTIQTTWERDGTSGGRYCTTGVCMIRIVNMMMLLWTQIQSENDEDITAGRCKGTGAGTNEDNRHMAKDRRQLLREWMKHGGEGPRYADD